MSDEEEKARLVKSALKSLAFTAPEEVNFKVRLYIETAFDRGVAAECERRSPTSGTGEP